MPYLAKNIREGLRAKDAKIKLDEQGILPPYFLEICTYDHGRDINGNGTAHYQVYMVSPNNDKNYFPIVSSGRKREQVGYSGANNAALYALDQLGYSVDESAIGSYDYLESKVYEVEL